MEEQIKKIVQKLRKMYRYSEHRMLMDAVPRLNVHLEGDCNLIVLDSVTFQDYDCIIATPEKVIYSPEHGQSKTLITYDGWEGLLSL